MTNQIVATPRDFLDVVRLRFGKLGWDVAANAENSVVDCGCFYGPGSEHGLDSLAVNWPTEVLNWDNPPFARIDEFSAKHVQQQARGAASLLIGPAAVCTGWFIKNVAPYAYVMLLTPRVFKKEIRDCFLAYYHPARIVGQETWRWR